MASGSGDHLLGSRRTVQAYTCGPSIIMDILSVHIGVLNEIDTLLLWVLEVIVPPAGAV